MSKNKGSQCPSCKEFTVESSGIDAQGGSVQKVCVSCGIVIEDGSYESTYQPQMGSSTEYKGYARSLPQTYAQMNTKKTPRCLKSSRKFIKSLSSQLNLSDSMKEQSINLFERMYYNPKYLLSTENNKFLMATASIYIVCLQNGWPISAEYMSKMTNFNKNEIIQMKKTITLEENLTINYVDLSDQVESLIHDVGLDRNCCQLTQEIIIVSKKSWITVGRNPIGFIYAAAFLAWKSQNILEHYNKTFSDFVRTFHVKSTKAHRKHLSEIIEVFITLSKELPWIDESLTSKTVIEHIPEICKFKQSLFTSVVSAENEVSDDENDSAGISKKRKYDTFDPPAFKTSRPTKYVKPEPVHYNGDLNSEDLCESDIPEKELSDYIKTRDEVIASKICMSLVDQDNK